MKTIWIGLLTIFAACTPIPEEFLRGSGQDRPDRNPNLFYYKIQVDSVAMVPGGIRAMGVIGSNGCHRFEHVESARNGKVLTLTFWGSRPVRQDVICTMQIPYMSEVVAIEDWSITEIAISQPDGSVIRRTLNR